MATINLQGTEFTFSVLPLKFLSKGYWARTEITVKNEYVTYTEKKEDISVEELERWIFSMFRLLAGAYGKQYAVTFEKSNLSIDLSPNIEKEGETTREERRKSDCLMSVHLLMRAKENTAFLNGVYSLLFHRKEVEEFALALRKEFYEVFAKFAHGRGKYLFVGVSPGGYRGCNYWYFDPTNSVKEGDYVWVRMGRHDTEQIVYVDSVRYFNEDTAPYDPDRVKRVLRKATEEELQNNG